MDETITEAAALQAAQQGYARKTGGAMPPAPTPEPVAQSEQPPADLTASPAPVAQAPAAVVDDEPSAQAAPAPSAQEAIASQLDDLKAQIRDLKANGVDPQSINRMNGQIGGLTRVLNKLEKQLAPSDNELAAAMAQAEKTAAEYPELGGAMLNVVKALAARLPEKQAEQEPPEAEAQPTQAQPPASPYNETQKALIAALKGLHPDRDAINENPEFKTWLAAKGREYHETFESTWDLAFLAKGYTDFKAAQAAKAQAKQRRQDQIVAAQTPSGVAATNNPLPDEAGLARGYARGAAKRHY
jgi:hypothetical protein